VLRHIAYAAEADGRVSALAVRSVYLALSQLSSDHGDEQFTVPVSEIAHVASVGVTTAGKALDLLREGKFIGVVRNVVTSTRFKAPSTYSLFNHEPSICSYCRALYNPIEGVQVENLCKDTEDAIKSPKKSPAPFVGEGPPDEWLVRAKADFPERGDLLLIARKLLRKYPRGHRKRTLQTYLHWVRIELNPIFRDGSGPGTLPEPSGWKEVIRSLFPKGANRVADECLETPWGELALEHQIQFSKDVDAAARLTRAESSGARERT
jgi:hypothetical protein